MLRRRGLPCFCVLVAWLLVVVGACRDSATVAVWVGGAPSAESSPAGSANGGEENGLSENGSTDDEPPAQNPLGGCGICHIDVEDEVVPTLHYKEKVGCVKCHGRSIAHAADENNEVAPDRLFTRENVDRFCETCHDPCDRAKQARRSKVRPVCIDCHGAHDLALVSDTEAEETDTSQ